MYNKMMSCLRCGNPLTGKQEKYCSEYCSKLYLKALYRRRHRDQINEYKKQYRRRKKPVVKYDL